MKSPTNASQQSSSTTDNVVSREQPVVEMVQLLDSSDLAQRRRTATSAHMTALLAQPKEASNDKKKSKLCRLVVGLFGLACVIMVVGVLLLLLLLVGEKKEGTGVAQPTVSSVQHTATPTIAATTIAPSKGPTATPTTLTPFISISTASVPTKDPTITTPVWTPLGQDLQGKKEGDSFGYDVALAADGKTLAISAIWEDGKSVQKYSWSSRTEPIHGAGRVRMYKQLNGREWGTTRSRCAR